MDGNFKCNRCGVTTRHDHQGNGCHACGSGTMQFVPADTAPSYQMWPTRSRQQRDYDEDGGSND